MRRILVFFHALSMLAIPLIANSQAFSKDDPIGAEQVFTTTDAEGWISDRSVYKIIDKTENKGKTTLTITQTSSTKVARDSMPVESSTTIRLIYSADNLIIPKENFTSSVSTLEDMVDGRKIDVSFSGDDPCVPLNPKPGQKLPDNEIKAVISIEGINAKMTMKTTDRHITARERISVPAGSFDAFLLEETNTAKVTVLILCETEKTKEKCWIVPGMGEVRTATYDKKGKLMSTTEMISYNR